MSEDPIIRGRRWKAFYDEEGGLRDMIEHIGMVYLERLSQVDPWETDKLSKLAMAHKITKQIDGMVRAIVADGDVKKAAQDYTARIESLPAAKRRWI